MNEPLTPEQHVHAVVFFVGAFLSIVIGVASGLWIADALGWT